MYCMYVSMYVCITYNQLVYILRICAATISNYYHIHTSTFKTAGTEKPFLKGQIDINMCTAVAVSAYHGGPGLHVCPPVQENLDNPEEAFLSGPVEGSPSILSETQKDNT